MQEIYIFIAAIIFVVVVFPVLQSISDTILALSQWVLSAINVRVTANNVKVADMNDSIQPTNSQAIGFSAPSEEEFYDDEEDDPEENKFQTGFRG